MSGRRGATVPLPRPVSRPLTQSDGVPRCPQCGFTGRPSAESTPYVDCGGDQSKHIRPPLRCDTDGGRSYESAMAHRAARDRGEPTAWSVRQDGPPWTGAPWTGGM